MSDDGLTRDVLTTLMPGFQGTTLPAWAQDALRRGLGGLCVFGTNVVDRSQLAALVAQVRAANPDAVVTIDEEGGDVTRLFYDVGSPFPGNAVLGRLDDVELTRSVGREVGLALREVGIDMTLAPCVDVNVDDDNPVIGVRSFGADADAVARHALAWTEGVQEVGVAACAKHFPGHGDTAVDSHLDVPVVHADGDLLRRRELVPFRALAGTVAAVMSSHLVVPALDPAEVTTFSRPVLHDLLRTELGFTGVVVSDALDMRGAGGPEAIPTSAVRALAAGCDFLCTGPGTTGDELDAVVAEVVAAVADGRLGRQRVQDAARRVRGVRRPAGPGDASVVRVSADVVRRAFDGEIPRADGDLVLVGLTTEPNIAVGVAPWGPFAALPPDGTDGVDVRHVSEADGTAALDDVPADARLVLVGRGNHRYPWVARLVAHLRERRDVLVVDVGWPSADRRLADVATFGASRLVGEALLEALGVGVAAR